MGQFRVDLTLLDRNGGSSRTVEALVDTGAAYSVVPRVVLESLGCRPVRTQRVVLANGRIEEWAVTQIDVECEGRSTTTPMLMGPAGGSVLLGATTLEELGLGIDPLNRRLIPVDLYLASTGRRATMKIVPLSEAKARLNILVDEVRERNEEILITKNGRPGAVLLSVDEVESWKETLAITSNRDFMEEIRRGLELLRKRKARLYTLEELFGGTS